MKAPQPVSLKGLPASRRVLVWLMLVFANGQGRPGACEERAMKGRSGFAGVEVVLVLSVWSRRLSVPGVRVCGCARVRVALCKVL